MDEMSLKKIHLRYTVVFIMLGILFLFALYLNINSGSVHITAKEIYEIIVNKAYADTNNFNIIWKIRLPRLLLAAVLGGGLSVSGFLLQTFFRNPIAGPFVLGISSGAKMMIAFTTIIAYKYIETLSSMMLVTVAFIGSLIAIALVLMISRHVKSLSMLLVAGIMIGYICSAVTDFFVAFANEYQVSHLYAWQMGNFSGASWDDLKIAFLIIGIISVIAFMLSKPISAYLLGEAYAHSLGVNIKVFRMVLILLSSILSATVTAFAGPISFVGIAVPHMAKLFLRSTKPLLLIPATFLFGASFCMICDLIARTSFAPTEMSLSTITAVFGAPVVLWLMLKRQSEVQ